MIPLVKGERLRELAHLEVRADSGEYSDVDLILCGDATDPEAPEGVYQAQFIRYGNLVYQFETPESLGEAIVALEPESTHDSAQLWREEEARRIKRMGGKLEPENPAPAPDALTEEPPIPATERAERKRVEREEETLVDEVLREAVDGDAIGGGGGPVEPAAGVEPLPVIDITEPMTESVAPAVDISTTTTE